jgi:hypothetical protein
MNDAPEKIWAGGREPEWFFDDPSDHRDGGYAEYTRTDIADAPSSNISALCKQLAKVSKERTDALSRIEELEATTKRDAKIYYDAKAIIDAHQVIYREAREEQRARIAELEEALKCVMGNVDTPIPRRRLGIKEPFPEWLIIARDALEGTTNE